MGKGGCRGVSVLLVSLSPCCVELHMLVKGQSTTLVCSAGKWGWKTTRGVGMEGGMRSAWDAAGLGGHVTTSCPHRTGFSQPSRVTGGCLSYSLLGIRRCAWL